MLLYAGLAFGQPPSSYAQGEYRFDQPDKLKPAPEDLQYAFIIVRHGIRSPLINCYATDDEYHRKWPESRGALTEDGKRLMVHVGQSLRSRYERLLPHYSDSQVKVTSTLSPRATMSAEAIATGLFPPQETLIDDIPAWQPIPVFHTADYDKHYLFDEVKDKNRCARYIQLKDSVMSDEQSMVINKQKRFIDRLNQQLARMQSQVKRVGSLEEIIAVWDTLYMEKLNLRPPSVPVSKDDMSTMTSLAQYRLWSRMHGKTSMIQFFTGPLFDHLMKELVDQSSSCLLKYISGENKCPLRMQLHGSHDLTVGAMVWTLGKQEEFLAEPGDTLILEMYERQRVKLFLYSPLEGSEERFKEISLAPLCGQDPCRLTQLADSIRDITLTEEQWKAKCQDLQTPVPAGYRKQRVS